MKRNLEASKLLITGGTGSFGNAVLDKFLDSNISEIRIFSRDELKQDDLRKKYQNSKLKFYLGDVRDLDSLATAMIDVDYVFHAAALKQVPSCEFYPLEAVKTNIIGTSNVLDVSIRSGVKAVICLSTDKAVYPINSMGMSKALMEKLVIAKSRDTNNKQTILSATRYGNVIGSRGSVIPLFIHQLLTTKRVTVTDPTMTRFMMSLENAVDLVEYAFENADNGDLYVQKAPAATIKTIVETLAGILQIDDYEIEIIGARHGEKLYESLLSKEEMRNAHDNGLYYKVSTDNRDLNYAKYFEVGDNKLTNVLHGEDYNSHNTSILDQNKLRTLLLKSKYFLELLKSHEVD